MSLLGLAEVNKFYGRQDVLKRCGFSVNPGERTGLVGPNGAGKTTVLRLILGLETPDSGQVLKAKGLRLGYLPQDLMNFSGRLLLDLVMDTAEDIRSLEAELAWVNEELAATARTDPADQAALTELIGRQGRLLTLYENLGGYTLEAEAKKILTGLGFSDQDHHRPVEEFSGGWIMRAVLARLLLAKPDLLLLDEPTNHLDLDSLLWLEKYLIECSSALLLVSHDRVFLNNVVQKIVEIDRGQAVTYAGNYDQYLEEKEKRVAGELAAYAGQQERIKQIERFIERNRVRAATARRVQSRIKMLEKMDRIEAPSAGQVQTFNLSLPPAARAPEILIEIKGVTKTYGFNTVYRNLDLTLRRGDRLAILGPNGRGKSTLLKLLSGAADFQTGSRRVGSGVTVGYFAQFQLEELDLNRTVLEELDTVAGDLTPGRQRNILAGFLFRGDDVFKKVGVLSGGEKSRLLLAKIMVTGPNLLLLDEPSNHLDIPGREMLEQALTEYDGTICLITHDRHLINTVANKVLVIQDGKVEVLPGNFDDYQNIWRDRLEAEAAGSAASETEPSRKPSTKASGRAEREARKKAEAEARKQSYRLRAPLLKEVENLERRQAELGRRMGELAESLAQPSTYQDQERSKALNLEYTRLKTEMKQITEAWEAAALKLEEIENITPGGET
ncbi:MAG: ABC-F family ATP-binding cassette domain-containing protein [Thermodesulfobacteriota bacterium]